MNKATPQSETHAGPLHQDSGAEPPTEAVGDSGISDTDDDVEEIGMDIIQRQNYQATRTPSDYTTVSFHFDPDADLKLDLLKPGIAMLFDHCKPVSLFFAYLPGV